MDTLCFSRLTLKNSDKYRCFLLAQDRDKSASCDMFGGKERAYRVLWVNRKQ